MPNQLIVCVQFSAERRITIRALSIDFNAAKKSKTARTFMFIDGDGAAYNLLNWFPFHLTVIPTTTFRGRRGGAIVKCSAHFGKGKVLRGPVIYGSSFGGILDYTVTFSLTLSLIIRKRPGRSWRMSLYTIYMIMVGPTLHFSFVI